MMYSFLFFVISLYVFENGYHGFLYSSLLRLNKLLKVIFVSIYPGSVVDEFVGSQWSRVWAAPDHLS